MGKKWRNRGPRFLEKVNIHDISQEGKGVGRHQEVVVFVEGTVPGDTVDVKVTKQRKSYYEGRPVKFHHESELRIPAFCDHFGVCGGCKWQSLAYEQQLKFKQKAVVDALTRIGHLQIPTVPAVLGANPIQYYRNKLEFTFSDKRWLTEEEVNSASEFEYRAGLGFHIAGHYDKVVDIQHCHLQADPSNQIRNAVSAYSQEHGLPHFNVSEQTGLLRNLMIRTTSTGAVMVVLSVLEANEQVTGLLDHLMATFPTITSLNYVVNTKGNDTIFDLEVVNVAGKDHVIEQLGHCQFKIGPKSFFQTNTQQALSLYTIVRDFAGLTGSENLYDLYTGTGTIALFLANQCAQVVGIEMVEDAIKDAQVNAQLNQIDNAHFYTGDMKDAFNQAILEKHGQPDLIITDPPRSGMHPEVVKQLLEVAAKKIVYVSCNPATQARDLELLGEKYEIKQLQPVDMFPHTTHIENVASLELKES